MQLSEKEIEDLFYNDLIENDGEGLWARGLILSSQTLYIKKKWFRQLNIDPYGIIDIAGVYRYCGNIYVELLELKAVPITFDHFEQILRYKKGLEVYLKNTFRSKPIIHCTLVGTSYSGFYIQNDLNVSVVTYSYDLDGVSFETTAGQCGWYIIEGQDKSFRDSRFKQHLAKL